MTRTLAGPSRRRCSPAPSTRRRAACGRSPASSPTGCTLARSTSGTRAPGSTGTPSLGPTAVAHTGSAKPPAASAKPAASSSGLEEDLAYLRVIALVREGRREEARLAAKDYLRRFPQGFRRVEVERIAR